MTGVLEKMHAELTALRTEVDAIKARLLNGGQPATTAQADPFAGLGTTTVADPLGGLGGTTQTPQVVATDEMVMKLVSDNVHNEAIKVQMKTILNQMGIPSLPETRPDQLQELYQRLSAVVAQATGQTAAKGPAGII